MGPFQVRQVEKSPQSHVRGLQVMSVQGYAQLKAYDADGATEVVLGWARA